MQLTAVLERGARHMAAERTLADALARAAPSGLRQTILDGGPEITGVLRRLTGKGCSGEPADSPLDVSAEYLAALADSSGNARAGPRDVLSARETGILRMLETGQTNQQIARALGVSVNTVKWYLKKIYVALEASNRSEAVSIARRENLLPG